VLIFEEACDTADIDDAIAEMERHWTDSEIVQISEDVVAVRYFSCGR
jgi:hypothetical protein